VCPTRYRKRHFVNTRWFKYDRDDLCVNKSQFVPVIFEPPCNSNTNEDIATKFEKGVRSLCEL
jgi:hypothetical protein